MPPKKRPAKPAEDEISTDDEKYQPQAKKSSSGRQINPALSKAEESKPKLKYDLEWMEFGEKTSKNVPPLYYLWSKTLEGRDKIAAFDIDNTIIETKSGKKFATNSQDWKFLDKSIPPKLKELNETGYRVVFITNQAGIEKGNVKFTELKNKFEAIVSELDIPVYIFVATGETHYRKPSIEMWKFLLENCNKSVKVNMNESVYVGDAAGRAKNWAPGRSKDFSCADRMFAANINIKFHTPEEYFMGYKVASFEWGSIDPNEVIKKHESKTKSSSQYHSSDQELVLLIGPPASGKSTFVKKYLIPHKYVHINRDTLQTQEKCLKAAEAAIKEGKSVCIDNTNPSKKVRGEYISLAKKHNIKQIRCFKMNTPIDLCHHLNYVRQNSTKGKIRRIPDVGYNMFKSQFEEPDVSEGFKEIVGIDFEPNFDSDEHKEIFKQWTF